MSWQDGVAKDILDAIWRQDLDFLERKVDCVCCCDEHTSPRCPARAIWSCRGQFSMADHNDSERWFNHYAQLYGMTFKQFFGTEEW